MTVFDAHWSVRVFLDGELQNNTQPGLGDALRDAASRAEAAGRMIVEVVADGKPLEDAALAHPDRYQHPILELRLTSIEPKELVRSTLLGAEDALEQAKADQYTAAEMIQSGQLDEARDPLASMLETWQAVREVVTRGSQVLRVDLDRVDLAKASGGRLGGRVADRSNELFATLDELKSALAREDWSAVGDSLAYDFDELVNSWQVMLRSLADHVAGMPVRKAPGGEE